jgi:hypothetical protein
MCPDPCKPPKTGISEDYQGSLRSGTYLSANVRSHVYSILSIAGPLFWPFALTGAIIVGFLLRAGFTRIVINRAQRIELIALTPVALVTVFFAAGWLVFSLAAIAYPFQIDYGEGGVLQMVSAILKGDPIYTDFRTAPYTVVNYPPVFPAATIVIKAVLPFENLAAGRFLSTLSSALLAGTIGAVIWTALGDRAERGARGTAALFGGIAFLSIYPVWYSASTMRVDFLAALFSGLGLLAFMRAEHNNKLFALAAVAFVLAGYTKQTSIAAPVACFIAAAIARPIVAVIFAGAVTTAAGLIFLAFNVAYDGEFYKHLILSNFYHQFRSGDWAQQMFYLLRTYPVFLVVGGLMTVKSLVGFASHILARWRMRPVDSSIGAICWREALPAIFWVVALLVSTSAAKSGAWLNHFIELIMATVILFSIAMARAWIYLGSDRWKKLEPVKRGLVAIVLVAIGLLIGIQVQQVLPQAAELSDYLTWMTSAQSDRYIASQAVLCWIKGTPGDVISEDRTMLILAGKRIYLEPHDMAALFNAGIVDQTPILDRVLRREIGLIVLERRSHKDVARRSTGPNSRFTPAMITAISENYQLAWWGGGYYVYEPSLSSASP